MCYELCVTRGDLTIIKIIDIIFLKKAKVFVFYLK